MYEIRPETVKTFITDRNISLPRFQRKQTWDEKKNFQLCISVFKGYPMGVCIINTERAGTKSKRFLIDGRQRRNALSQMYENPEVIGLWAKKFLGFKAGIDNYALGELFDDKIKEYLETDDDLFPEDASQDDNMEDADMGDTDNTDNTEDDDLDDGIVEVGNDGLNVLRNILLLTYKKSKHATGFTAPFDFTSKFSKLPFVDQDERNTYVINGKKLKSFIDEYRTECLNNEDDYDSNSDTFAKYLLERGTLKNNENKERTERAVKTAVSRKWKDICARFDIVEKMDNIMSVCKIGLIEVKGFKSADSQKIFNIINSEGVKLTAVEIMSAKSYWNIKINNPSNTMVTAAEELYKNMGIKISDVYKWDIPATLLSRLGDNVIFKQLSWDSAKNRTEFEKKLTLGFKVLAGIYKKGIKKEDVDAMGKDEDIDWHNQSEQTIKEICDVIKLIEDTAYFKFLKSWRTSIMELTSDSIALDFILILYFDFMRKGSPYGAGTKTKQFQKNAFILWDKLIYEYVTKQWRGSADSMIAKNIEALDAENDVFTPISKDKWIELLNEIYDNNTVNESEVSAALMKPILYHMYCIESIGGPTVDCTIEIDHIIPQSVFKSSTIPMKDVIQDNLFNLGLLPKRDNISKSNRKLKHIEDEWLISRIKHYEFIGSDKFEEFSSVQNYKKLFRFIKAKYDDAFDKIKNRNESKRDRILNN